MFKLLALVVILAAVVAAFPAPEEAASLGPKSVSPDGQADTATKDAQANLNGGDDSDLKGAETFGFAYYHPVVSTYGYGQGYGYGGYGGWGYGGGYGGYGNWYPTNYYYW